MKLQVFIGISLLALGGCASDQSEPNASEKPIVPTEQPEEQSARWQALPGIGTESQEESNCTLPEADWRGYEPNLDAWVSVSESIFVGTISSVTKVEEPARHLHKPLDAPVADIGVIAKEDCPEVFHHAIRFEFVDVETIHGEELQPNLTIQMGAQEGHNLHVVFPEGETQLKDYNGNPAYTVGARIGASLHTRADGSKIWHFRQFQVHDGHVYLQEIDHNKFFCTAEPYVLGIPDAFEGVPYEDFLEAVEQSALNPNMSQDILQNRDHREQGLQSALANPLNLSTYQPHCSTMEGFDADPSVPNDPDI